MVSRGNNKFPAKYNSDDKKIQYVKPWNCFSRDNTVILTNASDYD